MVEVFKTNVQEADESGKIILKLLEHFPDSKINFDLDDCDKILRFEADFIEAEKISFLLNSDGYTCEVLL